MTIDPLDLIRTRSRPQRLFRCAHCGWRWRQSADVPAGGMSCAHCGTHVGAAAQFSYASLNLRLLALLVDAALAVIPYVFVSLVIVTLDPWIPKTEDGDPTANAVLVMRAIVIAVLVLYVYVGEARGQSVGKRFAGIRVVRGDDWRRPGLVGGFVRLTFKVATLGLGYATILIDPQRRALHDRICGTKVVEV